MSNFSKLTKNPDTGKWEMANWLDNHFAPHEYGVQFPDGKIYEADEREWEVKEPDTLGCYSLCHYTILSHPKKHCRHCKVPKWQQGEMSKEDEARYFSSEPKQLNLCDECKEVLVEGAKHKCVGNQQQVGKTMHDWKDQFPFHTFYGKTKEQIVERIDLMLKRVKTEHDKYCGKLDDKDGWYKLALKKL